jgi:hypothetical protein
VLPTVVKSSIRMSALIRRDTVPDAARGPDKDKPHLAGMAAFGPKQAVARSGPSHQSRDHPRRGHGRVVLFLLASQKVTADEVSSDIRNPGR